VRIPHNGLHGHSDADVAVHALIDALLGAVALPDIGQQFPDNDPKYKGANSIELLKIVYAKIAEAGYALGNADITIIAEKPKLAAYIKDMRQTLADNLSVTVQNINVKATTEEGLGFGLLGISAHAVVLLTAI
jgi:2-C-methyl-D-erythritol 2,4-cyclodiphosphate synthase